MTKIYKSQESVKVKLRQTETGRQHTQAIQGRITKEKFIMTLFLHVLMLWLLSGAAAEVVTTFENQCDTFFVVKQPPIITPTPAFKKICQTLNNVVYYATLYDTNNKIPVYSAYKFEGLVNCKRQTSWYIEPQLDDNNAGVNMALKCTVGATCGNKQALNDNYIKSADYYHKGHLAPVYHASSQQCAQATFTLTNAAPQNKSFNSGQWRVTERNIANYLNNNCKSYTNYIVTGVVPGNGQINGSVNVPSHFWTAYCCLDNNNKCEFSQGYIGVNDKNLPCIQMTVSDLEKELRNLYKFQFFQLFDNSTKSTSKKRDKATKIYSLVELYF